MSCFWFWDWVMSEFTLGWVFVAGDSALHRINRNTFHRLVAPQTSPACDSYTADSHSNDRSFKLSSTYDTRRRLTINRCVHKPKVKSQKLMILFYWRIANWQTVFFSIRSLVFLPTKRPSAELDLALHEICYATVHDSTNWEKSQAGLVKAWSLFASTLLKQLYCCVKIRLVLPWCWWGLRIRRSGKLQFFG